MIKDDVLAVELWELVVSGEYLASSSILRVGI